MSEIKFPLAGDVNQLINPWALWIKNLSAQTGFINIKNIQTNNPELEREIIENVASYGKQLDKLHNVMAILIQHLPPDLPDTQKSSIEGYVSMTDQIEQSKKNLSTNLPLLEQLDNLLQAIAAKASKDPELLSEAKARVQNFIER